MWKSNSNVSNSDFGMTLAALRNPLRVLASIKEVFKRDPDSKLSTVTKNVLNMANSVDPDETPRFAASHLGFTLFVNALI